VQNTNKLIFKNTIGSNCSYLDAFFYFPFPIFFLIEFKIFVFGLFPGLNISN